MKSIEEIRIEYLDEVYDLPGSHLIQVFDKKDVEIIAERYMKQAINAKLEEMKEIKSSYEEEIRMCNIIIDYSSRPKEVIKAKAEKQAYEGFIKELDSLKQ